MNVVITNEFNKIELLKKINIENIKEEKDG